MDEPTESVTPLPVEEKETPFVPEAAAAVVAAVAPAAPAPAGPHAQLRRSTEDWFMMYDWPDEIYWGQGAPMSTYGGLHQFEALIADYQEEYLTTADDQEKEEIARDVLSELATNRTKIWRRVESTDEKKERGIPDDVEAWVETDEDFLLVEIKKVLLTPNTSPPTPLVMESPEETEARMVAVAAAAQVSTLAAGGDTSSMTLPPSMSSSLLPQPSILNTASNTAPAPLVASPEQLALVAQLGIMGDRERQLQTLLLLQQQELLVMQQRHMLQQQQHILAWQQNQLHFHQENVLHTTALSTGTPVGYTRLAASSTLNPAATPVSDSYTGVGVEALSHDMGLVSMVDRPPQPPTSGATAKVTSGGGSSKKRVAVTPVVGATSAPSATNNALDHPTSDLIRLSQAIAQELISRGVVPPK